MTQSAAHLAWIQIHQPADTRSAVHRFQQAAVELLEEDGWEEASIEEIARRAGSSPSAFRARFRDKDALLRSVHERFLAESRATADAVLAPERWEGCTIQEIIREAVAFSVQLYREREGQLRAFFAHSATDPSFRERLLEQSQHVAELLRKLILQRRKELLHPAPAVAAEFTTRLIQGMLGGRIIRGENGESGSIKLSDEQITTELIHAVLAYLGVFGTGSWDS